MVSKVKGIAKIIKNIDKLVPNITKKALKELKGDIVDVVVEQITQGLSPVKGSNRYEKYSSSYSKKKGRSAPVDLVDTGNFLGNMQADITARNSLTISFNGSKANDIAKGHQFGKNNLPVRKILPASKGEVFKKKILDKINKIVKEAANEAVKESNK